MRFIYSLILVCLFFQTAYSQDKTSPGLHKDSLNFEGLNRTFMYYIPSEYAQQKKLPVVFFLHGLGASAQVGVDVLGPQYHARADRDQAIVVYAEATSKPRHWNDKLGGSFPATDHVNDVAYLSSLIDHFIENFKGDKKRVYFSGSSNGGMMTYRLTVDIPHKIAAAAPFISAISPEVAVQSQSAPPVPIIITSGTADSVIKWDGGRVNVTRTPRLLSADDNVAYWVKRNGANPKAVVKTLPDVEPEDKSTVEVQEYRGKYPVILYKVIGGAHQHPTLREPGKRLVPGKNMDYNSFETVWDFLLSFRKK